MFWALSEVMATMRLTERRSRLRALPTAVVISLSPQRSPGRQAGWESLASFPGEEPEMQELCDLAVVTLLVRAKWGLEISPPAPIFLQGSSRGED